MSAWVTDPRAKRAEENAFEAELAEAAGDNDRAKNLWLVAAADYVPLAYAIPPEEPNARGAIGISAVACLARGGDFVRAVDIANRLLAQSGALSSRARGELVRMAENYAEIVRGQHMGTKSANAGHRMRSKVRPGAKDAA